MQNGERMGKHYEDLFKAEIIDLTGNNFTPKQYQFIKKKNGNQYFMQNSTGRIERISLS